MVGPARAGSTDCLLPVLEFAVRPSRRPIVIATRRSTLARAQALAVARALGRMNGGVEVKLLALRSEGDRHSERHPGGPPMGKGLFTGRLESALLEGRADVAVHSMKDMPVSPTPGLVIAATPQRGDPRDCLIAPEVSRLDDLREGASFGTSSPRRAAQVLHVRPDLRIVSLRGNIETRLNKALGDSGVDATLLAMAGLQRGGLAEHARCPIEVDQMLPAPAQGALAIQCRADDHVTLRRCLPLNDPRTAACVEAERLVVEALGGDCRTPIAALAELMEGERLRLRARVLSGDGRRRLSVDRSAVAKQSRRLAEQVVEALVDQGAREVLRGG